MSDQPAEVKVPEPAPPGTHKALGRLPAIDHRDRRFSMAAPPSVRTSRSWLGPKEIWFQGQSPHCVSYGVNRFLVSHNIVNKPPLPLAEFYHQCQLNDEWPGEDYDGTSVRAGFKVLKDMGYVSSYTWATEAAQVVRQLLEVSPVVIGVDWTSSMFDPVDGYLNVTGEVVGGHCVMLSAVNTKRVNPDQTQGAVRVLNSWGANWGEGGRAWLTISDLQKLLDGLTSWPGEACTATELKHV